LADARRAKLQDLRRPAKGLLEELRKSGLLDRIQDLHEVMHEVAEEGAPSEPRE